MRLMLLGAAGIFAVASATTSMLARNLYSIIWRPRRMSTTARTVKRCLRASATCAGTYQLMMLSVSRCRCCFL